MIAYAAQRALLAAVTLVLITFVVYGLIRAMPGNAANGEESQSDLQLTNQQIEDMRRTFLLDRHWTVAYVQWLGKALTGDLGSSLHLRVPVLGAILGALGPTLLLTVTSLGLSYLLSVPLGVLSAQRAGSIGERILGVALFALYSIPAYVMAILLMLVFGVQLGWLPLSGLRGADHDRLSLLGKLADLFVHMLLPVFCYAYGSLAYLTRFVRSSMLEVLQQDYVLAARARGIPEGRVVWNHAFRNALVPFVTLVGLSLPALLGGSVILEYLFSWPGMGRLFFDAIGRRDYTLILGMILAYGILVLAGTLLADLLYALVDPRVSYSRVEHGTT